MFVGFFDVIREKPEDTGRKKKSVMVHGIRSPFRYIMNGDVFHHFWGYISLTTKQIPYMGIFYQQ